jgi:hypothetical protein
MDMSWIESSLARLERQLSNLIEGDQPAEGIPGKLHRRLEKELVLAMRTVVGKYTGKTNGSPPAVPDEYTLVLPPSLAELLLTHPRELDILACHLEVSAGRAGLRFANPPLLRVVADPDVSGVKVAASYNQAAIENSRTALLDGSSGRVSQAFMDGSTKAFIIVNGLSTVVLSKAIINVGRDATNDIQINDLRVSRLHAQIRYVQGQFVIFDLDSRGGTTVNDVTVASHILSPGDVILLAGVPLVYGQEQVMQDGYTQEVPSAPLPPEAL